MSESAHPDSATESWQAKVGAAPFDSYRLLGIIGQGGMGTVYKAYHLTLKRFVAIKVLRIDRVADPDLASRFLREMQAVGQMDHPNVVRAADAGKRNGVFYLIMEYLDGADLSRLVAERGPLPAADACELARQAAVGLDYIHQTLVHRDVKPSNLILTPSGVVKILDLGLARLHEGGDWEGTPTGFALGTYDYQAPEQAVASSRVDGRADVYSLGCTLFKLLTGRAPFPGPEFDSAARKLQAHSVLPLTAAPDFPLVPEPLRPVLLRMTAKDPAERYASAREVAEALAPFAAGSQPARLLESAGGPVAPRVQPLPSRPPEEIARLTVSSRETASPAAAARPTPAPRRRRRLPAVAVAALLVCALAAAAWFVVPLLLNRPGDGRPLAPEPDEVRLPPPPAPLIELEKLPRLNWHNLLGPGEPPTLVGYREGDGQTTGRWMPGRQQIEINPVGAVFLQLGADDRQAPGFTFEVLMSQRPWSGGVGVFWGYQEDAAAKAAHQPWREFAHCQLLLLGRGQAPGGGLEFFVDRADAHLSYDTGGGVALGQNGCSHDYLPAFGGGEKLVQIDVEGGQLQAARFGEFDLTAAHQPGANRKFQPADYRGAFGVLTGSANVTIRQPRVMPHED